MSNGAKKFLVFFIAATLIVLLRQLFSDYLALKYFSGIIIGLAAIFIVSNLGKTKNRNEADATEPAGAIKRYLNADNGVHIEARAISIRIAIALSIVIFVSGAFVINIYALNDIFIYEDAIEFLYFDIGDPIWTHEMLTSICPIILCVSLCIIYRKRPILANKYLLLPAILYFVRNAIGIIPDANFYYSNAIEPLYFTFVSAIFILTLLGVVKSKYPSIISGALGIVLVIVLVLLKDAHYTSGGIDNPGQVVHSIAFYACYILQTTSLRISNEKTINILSLINRNKHETENDETLRKLRALLVMKTEGLISEEEYESKRQEILKKM